ncbi:MAG TPA: hypothetical protein VLK84_09590 [Longimicrobium sp.]|nr:hypothetical protein [Longimicrobium sp.]
MTRRELRDNTAPTLYDAIAQLRPDWLLLGAGMAPRSSAEGVVVFVNGKHVGALDALRAIEPGQVLAVRVRTPDYVRRTNPRFPREEFGAALFVDLQRPGSERPRGRLTVSPEVGFSVLSLAGIARAALSDEGYVGDLKTSSGGTVLHGDAETTNPVVLGGSVHYRMRGAWGGALGVYHTLEGQAAGADPTRYLEAVSSRVTSTEATLLLTRQAAALRVGAGPAVRMVDWSWADAYCECDDRETSGSTAVGVAGEVVASLPVSSLPVFPQFKVLARYYPSQQSEFSKLGEPLEVGGLVLTMGVGIATHF